MAKRGDKHIWHRIYKAQVIDIILNNSQNILKPFTIEYGFPRSNYQGWNNKISIIGHFLCYLGLLKYAKMADFDHTGSQPWSMHSKRTIWTNVVSTWGPRVMQKEIEACFQQYLGFAVKLSTNSIFLKREVLPIWHHDL